MPVENLRLPPIDLPKEEAYRLWEEIERLLKIPLDTFAFSEFTGSAECSFRGASGFERDVSAANLKELEANTRVPDSISELTIYARGEFRSNTERYQTKSRTITLTVTGDSWPYGVRVRLDGERDWIAGAAASIEGMLERRARSPNPERIFLVLAIILPIGYGIVNLSQVLRPLSDEASRLLLVLAVLVVWIGGMILAWWVFERAVPSSRVALRGEAKDSRLLVVTKDVAYLLLVSVVIQVALAQLHL